MIDFHGAARGEETGEERFVAGSVGPTGFLPASDDPIRRWGR